MKRLEIEFFGGSGRVHNVRFAGEPHANLEVILGVFYEEVALILKDIRLVEGGQLDIDLQNNYDFGDFISGELRKDHTVLRPDGIKSKTYKVRTKSLKSLLEGWLKFQSRGRNGVVERVSIDAEVT